MDCPTCEAMVDAYLDGELSAGETIAFENALANCSGCRARLAAAREISALLRTLPREPAPDLLRARVERELRTVARPSRTPMRWTAMAASLLAAVGIGWLGGTLVTRSGGVGPESGEAVASYLRVAMAEHPVDVYSSDRHTVKPWFAGRIDYAPPVHDLTAEGFPLIGGRLDVLDGRKVAVLVYRRNQHKLALTLWPSAGRNTPPQLSERDGFAIVEWRHAGFEMRAVSDLAAADLLAFAKATDQAIDSDS